MEYFNIAKSVWELVFDSVHLIVRKNKKNLELDEGFFYFKDKKEKKIYVWEYKEKLIMKGTKDTKITTSLIYNDKTNKLTVPKIIKEHSKIDHKSKLPVIEVFSKGEFPIEETLLPLFKRKIMAYLTQKRYINETKEVN
jgi:hypothetical protein